MNQITTFQKRPMTFKDFSQSIYRFDRAYQHDITDKKYFGFPMAPILSCENALKNNESFNIAYFSMEFGIAPSIYNSFKLTKEMDQHNQFYTHDVFSNDWLSDYLFKVHIDKMLDIPIYGGGLGVLAGDAIKSAADLHYPVVALGILWNKGYFKQNFWYKHGQIPEELTWNPNAYPGLVPLKQTVTINTKEGPLLLRLWKYYVYSYDKDFVCPLILLDSNLPENSPHFQKLTDQLYRSDNMWWKIFQRAILGIGGMKALKALGYQASCYHLNEGHAAFALIEHFVDVNDEKQWEQDKHKFVYTCHTPVVAGHDRFSPGDMSHVLSDNFVNASIRFGQDPQMTDLINLTYLCLNNCSKVNAVSQKHGDVMRLQFPDFAPRVQAITNGVHAPTWMSEHIAALLDEYKDVFGAWRSDYKRMANIERLRGDAAFRQKLFNAHQANKRNLTSLLKRWKLDENVLTVGWARRIAGYKRPALIFHNTQRIIDLARQHGALQIVLAGKAHPNDNIGSAHIEEILDHIDKLNDYNKIIKVLILENYDTYFGKLLTNSVDVWLNNPLPPFEASGTSGMKAILNGVLQLSTLDGWVVEAADKDIGWIFGFHHQGGDVGSEKDLRLDEDSNALYDTLAQVSQLYYQTNQKGVVNVQSAWIDKMINCIAQGAFFNTSRMMEDYYREMWKR